ncbi:hypothetical protein ACU684_16985 [Pseudomonas sp. LF135]|uniref:hypothetical protein n=1 Tax=Pseudomonas antarctica TaxID=219572 RepID=UPI00345D86F7
MKVVLGLFQVEQANCSSLKEGTRGETFKRIRVTGDAGTLQSLASSNPDYCYRADLCTGCIIAAYLNNTIGVKLKSVNVA